MEKNKVALITGAANGIGEAIALMLAERGFDIAVNDWNVEGAEQTAEKVKELGRKAIAVPGDVSNSKDVNGAIEKVIQKFDRLDILVNNAGIFKMKPVTEITNQEWHEMISIHLYGTFYFCRAAVPHLTKHRHSKIINISSAYGQIGESNCTHYSAAKAGILGFTKALAKELAPDLVNVNAIAPCWIMTPLQRQVGLTLEQMGDLAQGIPFKYWAGPEEVGYLVAFLASEEANYITGQLYGINGGNPIVGI